MAQFFLMQKRIWSPRERSEYSVKNTTEMSYFQFVSFRSANHSKPKKIAEIWSILVLQ